jgi:diguanylate cyclase (GGDEF)-like protein
MAMAQPLHNRSTDAAAPRTTADLRQWVREHLSLDDAAATALFSMIDQVIARQRQLIEESKHEAIRALSEGFAAKMERFQHQLTEKDVTVSNIARYFEEVVADLTEKSHRDPKTKLLNFDWFMERVESFLAVEQRVRWCGVGVVDINSFKWYNDTLGHAVGDRIIDRVARLLREQVRSDDLIAQESLNGPQPGQELHARFGGDEFCFLIPDLDSADNAWIIADRFREAVERYDWLSEDERLAGKPVRVDVGIVCLLLGAVTDRRPIARTLANSLLAEADRLMYDAKTGRANASSRLRVRIEGGALVELKPDDPAGE